MSTLSIAPAFVDAGVNSRRPIAGSEPPLRLTRRGRVVVILGFLTLALALMLGVAGWATAGDEAGAPPAVRVITIYPGDTLYGLASDLAPEGKVREWVHEVQKLNSLPDGALQVGQELALPVS